MSQDIRRRLAYFGAREKVYTDPTQVEIEGLPLNWRRLLSLNHPSPVVGPFGCVYADAEHAMCAYRYLHTSNAPSYANFFRTEYESMAGTAACRKWGCANGMSKQLVDPNDRVWSVVRDRCMFDLLFQRLCRDADYFYTVQTLVNARCIPVYHVRTANENTYWGATMDRTKLMHTQRDRDPHKPLEETLDEIEADKCMVDDPRSLLVGRNRLGDLMVEAYHAMQQYYFHYDTTKFYPLVGRHSPPFLTSLGWHFPNRIGVSNEQNYSTEADELLAGADELLQKAVNPQYRTAEENRDIIASTEDPVPYEHWSTSTADPSSCLPRKLPDVQL